MTQRKPPGMSWETWIDRQIRVGMEEGAFDDLPGTGKPMRDLDRPRDELWWVRDKLKREDVQFLPPTLQVRKEFDRALERIAAASSEAEVRAVVDEINVRVRWVNSRVTAGPPSTVAPLDPEAEVRAWRAKSTGGTDADGASPDQGGADATSAAMAAARPEVGGRPRWWQRTRLRRPPKDPA